MNIQNIFIQQGPFFSNVLNLVQQFLDVTDPF